jgi:hypothetical protein
LTGRSSTSSCKNNTSFSSDTRWPSLNWWLRQKSYCFLSAAPARFRRRRRPGAVGQGTYDKFSLLRLVREARVLRPVAVARNRRVLFSTSRSDCGKTEAIAAARHRRSRQWRRRRRGRGRGRGRRRREDVEGTAGSAGATAARRGAGRQYGVPRLGAAPRYAAY